MLTRSRTRELDILVVDDESEMRELLRRTFEAEGHRVTTVADGDAAIDRATTDRFDIVVLDVALGRGPSGYDVCERLRERRNTVPIIMLTARDSEADAVLGLESGADDYVTKPFGLAELRSRISAVLRRAVRDEQEDVLELGRLRIDSIAREVTLAGSGVGLTFSEFEMLAAMAREPNRVFTREELLRAIWGDSAYRDPRGIDVHVRHLREKLEAEPDNPKILLTVRGVGYRIARS